MDNQSGKEIENTSKTDRITNSPGYIIDNILICLPIHEAVRSCIFSKKWRFKWRYLSKLAFDHTFHQKSVLPSASEPNIAKLFFNIYKVLLLHHGPILNFTFHAPLLEDYPEINQLILYLREKDVSEIDLYFRQNRFHRLPSFLFSCVTLRRLTLSCCTFRVPLGFQGFAKLISLKFQSVCFRTNVYKTFISKCPLLETLSILSCTTNGDLDIDIDITYLKFLHISGYFKALYFGNTCQHLSTALFDGYVYEPAANLFESLPVIKHMRLGFGFLLYLVEGSMLRKLSVTLGCLRILELPVVYFGCKKYVSAVLCLITSSPNLQKLEIGSFAADDNIDPLAPELFKVEDLLDNALKRLRVVKMKISHKEEVKPELEFIKFLLAESVVLEKMFIQPAEGADAGEGFKILKEITRFKRSSSEAEILFLDPEDATEC